MSTDESIEEMRLRIRELSTRVEIQETQVASLRSQLGPGVAKPSQAEPSHSKQRVSRAGLLKMAGIGAAVATAAGFDLTARGSSAFASDGDAVSAGKETKAEHGTTVTYDGKSGFTGAVLLGSDSTYGNSDFSFPSRRGRDCRWWCHCGNRWVAQRHVRIHGSRRGEWSRWGQ